MSNIRLKCYNLRDDLFGKLLEDYDSKIVNVTDVDDYLTGYKDKQTIYYDGKSIICQEYIVNNYCNCIEDCTEWKQCKVTPGHDMESTIIQSMDGSKAYRRLMNILLMYYSEEEIEECFKAHEAEYDSDLIQFHHTPNMSDYWNRIIKFEDCIYYDINGAHNDALCEIFPRAKNYLVRMFRERHDKPLNKVIINYAVGQFCNENHRKTYNWIVQRTTKRLNDALDLTGNEEIYANTDGFVISAGKGVIGASRELGEFKIAYRGDVYVYNYHDETGKTSNYWIMQMGDLKKGSCLTCVRDMIDLTQGKVVTYSAVRLKHSKIAVNIKEKKVCVE